MTKYIVKVLHSGRYYRRYGGGTTAIKAYAFRFTAEELAAMLDTWSKVAVKKTLRIIPVEVSE